VGKQRGRDPSAYGFKLVIGEIRTMTRRKEVKRKRRTWIRKSDGGDFPVVVGVQGEENVME